MYLQPSINLATEDVALLISILALILSIVSLLYRNKFYKNSLRPLGNFRIRVNFIERSLKVILSNKGVGPAIIKKLHLTIDDEVYRVDSPKLQRILTNYMAEVAEEYNLNANIKVSLGHYESDEVISAKESKNILSIDFNYGLDELKPFTSFVKKINGFTFYCRYQSIYKQDYETTSLIENLQDHSADEIINPEL